MKVYVIYVYDFNASGIDSVFSTREKAEKFLDKYEGFQRNIRDIEEWTVDEEI